MGELVGYSLINTENESCGKCGMEKHAEESKDCCKDVSIVVKTADSHTFFQPVYDVISFTLAIPENHSIICDVSIKQERNQKTYRAHSPPLLKYPLFIQHQNFRI